MDDPFRHVVEAVRQKADDPFPRMIDPRVKDRANTLLRSIGERGQAGKQGWMLTKEMLQRGGVRPMPYSKQAAMQALKRLGGMLGRGVGPALGVAGGLPLSAALAAITPHEAMSSEDDFQRYMEHTAGRGPRHPSLIEVDAPGVEVMSPEDIAEMMRQRDMIVP